jgi:hypothetical protein
MENKIDSQVKDSGIKVAGIQTAQQKPVRYVLPLEAVANRISNSFHGITPKILGQLEQGLVLYSELELRKKGCTFATIEVSKDCAKDSQFRATHRITNETNPFRKGSRKCIQKFVVQVLLHCYWQKSVESARAKSGGVDTGWQQKAERENGIQNVDFSGVVCHKTIKKTGEERTYINYIVFRYLSPVSYVDENGQELDSNYIQGFWPDEKKVQEYRQREADKHGIQVEFDPQIRQIRLDNVYLVRMDEVEYEVLS